MDVLAILMTLPAPIARVVIARFTENPYERPSGMLMVFLFSILTLWLVALVLNIIGSIKGRSLSIAGLVLNLAFVAMVIFRWQ
jgi:hypothetical protein